MIQRNFNVSLEKGEYGERIVRRILEARGYVVYKPSTEGAHAFDILAIKDKSKCIVMDVKAKARRNAYPDTGISLTHHATYHAFSVTHLMPFWVVFVDEMTGQIYGNTLDELNKTRYVGGNKYPMDYAGKTRYWPLEAMIVLYSLTADDMEALRNLSQRNHEYKFSD